MAEAAAVQRCTLRHTQRNAAHCKCTALQMHRAAPHHAVPHHAGVYVWGKTWIQAKTQAECYDYLFEAAVRMRQLGIDASQPPAPLIADGGAANGHAANGTPAAKKQKTGQVGLAGWAGGLAG
jgi:ribulose-5-phosphate 4-epimerase/fuculose-1-phosphate aldolase